MSDILSASTKYTQATPTPARLEPLPDDGPHSGATNNSDLENARAGFGPNAQPAPATIPAPTTVQQVSVSDAAGHFGPGSAPKK